MEAANLPAFLKFGNTKNQKFVLPLQKIMGGHKTGGLCPHDPGLKLPLSIYNYELYNNQ